MEPGSVLVINLTKALLPNKDLATARPATIGRVAKGVNITVAAIPAATKPPAPPAHLPTSPRVKISISFWNVRKSFASSLPNIASSVSSPYESKAVLRF